MQDITQPPMKPTGGYHFTSTVQDMINGGVIQEKILNVLITLQLKEVIGVLADLQKHFANPMKT